MDDPYEHATRYQKVFLSHIVCPDHIVNQNQVSWLVGWNLDHFKCFIIDYVPQSLVKLEALEQTLHRIHEKYDFFHYNHFLRPRNAPIVLGKWIPDISTGYLPSSTHQSRGIWVTLCRRQGRAGLFSIHSLGNLYNTSVYMIGYPLVRTEYLQSIALSQPVESIPSSTSEQEVLVGLINTHQDVHAILAHTLSEPVTEEATAGWVTSLLSGLLAVSWVWYALLVLIKRFSTTTQPLLSYAMDRITWRELQLSSHRSGFGGGSGGSSSSSNNGGSGSGSGSGGISNSNSASASSSGSGSSGGGGGGGSPSYSLLAMQKVSLESVSIAWYQLHQKAQQFQYAIQSAILLTLSWEIDSRHRSKYWMRVWSTLCYLALDLALGLALAVCLLRHSHAISSWLGAFFHSSFLGLENVLASFRQSPGGVKLNPYITRKLGKGLVFFLRHWRDVCIASVSSYCPRLLWLLAILSPFGLSVQVGVALDFARVLVLPLTLFHSLFAVEFAFHVQLVYSLYLFFKSSKKNVLRQRYDSCEYDADQLPFGTMLFSIMLFLLPSFAIYYYSFSVLQAGLLAGIYAVFVLVETTKVLPYYQVVGASLVGALPLARMDTVEIVCQGVARRTADGREEVDEAAGRGGGEEARGRSPWTAADPAAPRRQGASPSQEGGGGAATPGQDRVQRQLLEGLIEGLSPLALQKAEGEGEGDVPQSVLCFDASAWEGQGLLPRRSRPGEEDDDEEDEEEGDSDVPVLSLLRGRAAGLVDRTTALVRLLGSYPVEQDPRDQDDDSEEVFAGRAVHHRVRKGAEGAEGPGGRLTQDSMDDLSSSPSASVAASIASQSLADIGDSATWGTGTSQPSRMGFEGRWGGAASFLASPPATSPVSVAMYMSYRPRRPRWSQHLAGLASWLRFLAVDKSVVWPLVRRVCGLRPLRCTISQVAVQYHQQVQRRQDEEAWEIVAYLFPRLSPPASRGLPRGEEDHDEHRRLVAHALPFRRTMRFLLTGRLDTQAGAGAGAATSAAGPAPHRDRRRYSARVVWGIALLMAASLASLLGALVGCGAALWMGGQMASSPGSRREGLP